MRIESSKHDNIRFYSSQSQNPTCCSVRVEISKIFGKSDPTRCGFVREEWNSSRRSRGEVSPWFHFMCLFENQDSSSMSC
jgi:hypothetical protein